MHAHIRPAIACGLTALGSLFWLTSLADGIAQLLIYGLYGRGELIPAARGLVLLPLPMTAGTLALGRRAALRRAPARMIMAASLVAAFALLLCLGVLGAGV